MPAKFLPTDGTAKPGCRWGGRPRAPVFAATLTARRKSRLTKESLENPDGRGILKLETGRWKVRHGWLLLGRIPAIAITDDLRR